MIFVVDASVAVKWFVQEDRRDLARELLRDGIIRVAPDIVFVEVANALRKKTSLGEMGEEHANRALDDNFIYFANVVPTKIILGAAFALSVELAHPVADCMYLACARQLGAKLVSDDEKFVQKCQDGYSDFVISLTKWTLNAVISRAASGIPLDEAIADKLTRLAAVYDQTKLRVGRRWFEGEVAILAERDLRKEILSLTKDQITYVVALCWFGALELFNDSRRDLLGAWARHLSQAETIASDPETNVTYIISKLHYLETGMRLLSSLIEADD